MLSSKLTVSEKGVVAGRGLIASEQIEQGEIIWSPENDLPFVSDEQRKKLPNKAFYSQIDWNLFAKNDGKEWCLNHSCVPNCALKNRKFIAMRDIQVGEEATYDYGLTETGIHWAFWCDCGNKECRRHVTNFDYFDPDLRKRMEPYCAAHALKEASQLSSKQVFKHKIRQMIYRTKVLIFGTKTSAKALFK